MRKLFECMDDASKRFYLPIFNTALLNSYAVQHGHFDTLLCETDDPRVALRWEEAAPAIIELIKEANERRNMDPEK